MQGADVTTYTNDDLQELSISKGPIGNLARLLVKARTQLAIPKVPLGYWIGGPNESKFYPISTAPLLNIAELAKKHGDDTNDYTVTTLYGHIPGWPYHLTNNQRVAFESAGQQFGTEQEGELRDWRLVHPFEALHMDSLDCIRMPINSMGDVCPWPWDPQQLLGAPLGQYHCPYCGDMAVAGVPHPDYSPEAGNILPHQQKLVDEIRDGPATMELPKNLGKSAT